MSGIEMANWNWKVVRQFVSKRFGIGLSRSSCLNYPVSTRAGSEPAGICLQAPQEAPGQD